MEFELTKEQLQWKQEVTEFLKAEMTPDFLEELEHQDWSTTTFSIPFSKKLAAKGWVGLTLPEEYCGQGRPYIDQAIMDEQMGYYHAPIGAHHTGASFVSWAVLRHGTEEQKRRLLPPIAKQEVVYAQGFTEPQAGTDLASLVTKAVRDGDSYIIKGEKMYCSGAHHADQIFLATRTDQNLPRHKGISVFIVDLKSPGITIIPMITSFHGRVNQLFFDDVRVPAVNMVGEINQGWPVIMTALTAERGRLYGNGYYRRIFDELVSCARETTRNGSLLIDDPIVQYRLAEWEIVLEAARMLTWRVAWMRSKRMMPGVESNIESLFMREREHQFFNFAMEILGRRGQLQLKSKWSLMFGLVERMYRRSAASTGGGGNIELSKNVIALRGLGLPKG